MGRIVTHVAVENSSDHEQRIECDALVDTGASHMILPTAWRARLGELRELGTVELETADQSELQGAVCGPVQIQIEGFRPIFSEVIFVDMNPEDGQSEPLVGYTVLEQSQAAVDTLGHRLVHVKRLDLKRPTADKAVQWTTNADALCRHYISRSTPAELEGALTWLCRLDKHCWV